MRKIFISIVAIFFVCFAWPGVAQNVKTATIRMDSEVKHQKITGFGGFVNSPQFAYGHMSEAEIKKLWGKDSETRYNIMRLFIPSDKNYWNQAISTAKLAKSLDLIVFASPWSMPAAWKTNGSTSGIVDGNRGYLKEEHYADYANYLNDFVVLLRNNGVELDAISIQNEPDFDVTYAGCYWTPSQMASFLKNHASVISCPIMVSETVALSNANYINALAANDVIDKFAIYAGHQYGGVGTAHKQLQAKGKEVWQSEFLINWNDGITRDFNWSIDAFNFANAINTCMLSDVNAWVHYASKRYYGMMGDGTNGTVTGRVTKRGYILSHFARYATGTTRIENTWNDESNTLKGSSYLSVTGDSLVVMVINSSNNPYLLTADLPFYTRSGKSVTTTSALNWHETEINLAEESCRPKIDIAASSFTTLIFVKSNEREPSLMNGEAFHPHKIDQLTATKAAFGTNYKLSGKTIRFEVNTPLISANTNTNNGYLELDAPYNRLVFEIASTISANQYNSDNTTLYYINQAGAVRSHNYGKIHLNQSGSSTIVLDISSDVLTDGCKGILSISNSNYSSILTLALSDVYLAYGDEKFYRFSGDYSNGDSDLLDCLDDASVVSLDFTETTGISSDTDWRAFSANPNAVYYLLQSVNNNKPNVISGTSCGELRLTDAGGNFYLPSTFTATNASYSCTVDKYALLTLPFEASIPSGIKAYTLQASDAEIICARINDKIPANTPVLLEGDGAFVFEGSGVVSSLHGREVGGMTNVYISTKAPAGSYYLPAASTTKSLQRVNAGETVFIPPFSAYLASPSITSPSIPLGINQINAKATVIAEEYYTLTGQRVVPGRHLKGIHIVKRHMSDGSTDTERVFFQ